MNFKRYYLNEAIVEIPSIPNTMNFFHGGNLDNFKDNIVQKIGRYEYGPGLYLTTHYDTALKYSKGSRKLYLVTVELGNELKNTKIDIDLVKEFINSYTIKTTRKDLLPSIEKYTKDGSLKANIFLSTLLNYNAIKPIYGKELRNFLIKNKIDYELVENAFGWHETMMVLYNMNKIKKITQIKSSDKLPTYDLKETK
jgi:hypothetical protein